jgi:23S rRNA pseudouridine1911/1915/1917 synthase
MSRRGAAAVTADPRDGSWRLPDDQPPDRLDRALKALLPGASWRDVRDLVARGKVAVDGCAANDAGARVTGGQRIDVRMDARRRDAAPPRTAALPAAAIVHGDRHVVVVHKPAGLDTVPWTGGEAAAAADTLVQRLAAALGGPVRVVHRLDRDTTGLLVFARTAEAEGRLAHQFRRHSVHRRYFALAHGRLGACTIRSHLADDRGDGLRGSVRDESRGRLAVTHVEVVEELRGATLVACRLETGRTHQIRIHLAERGHMLLGERAYVREHEGAALPAPRILLHAAELGFLHPSTDAPLRFVAPLPDDMQAAVAALRAPPDG